MDPKTSRRTLNDRSVFVRQKVFMEAAFAAIEICTEFFRRHCEAFLRVEADGAERHCGKHNRRLQFELRREMDGQLAFRVPNSTAVRRRLSGTTQFNPFRFASDKHARLHRFAQRVDRRVRHLRRVQKHMVPVNRIRFRSPHSRKKDASRVGLFENFLNVPRLPVGRLAHLIRVFTNRKRMRRAQRHAALAVDTFFFMNPKCFSVRRKIMNLIGALAGANAALNAALLVPFDEKFWKSKINSHNQPQCFFFCSFFAMIIPARSLQTRRPDTSRS